VFTSSLATRPHDPPERTFPNGECLLPAGVEHHACEHSQLCEPHMQGLLSLLRKLCKGEREVGRGDASSLNWQPPCCRLGLRGS
jgi:hypothetical protein